jgi:transposase
MNSKSTKKSRRMSNFATVNPNAAGIDIGDSEIVVAIGPKKCEDNVRTFGTFTSDLKAIITFLSEHSIDTAAMECTGVYWVQLYLLLEEHGIEVIVGNARSIKSVSGRKDDESDAMWIQRLHTCGLIRPCFQPDLFTRELRELMRYRKNLVQDRSKCTNRIMKALELMNIKVHTVISDIDGKSGRAIIDAILKGERNPAALALQADPRIKASRETLEKSLAGNWNDIQLFILSEQSQLYDYLSNAIRKTDQQIEEHLLKMIISRGARQDVTIDKTMKRKRSTSKNEIPFHATAFLKTLLGINLTAIPGVNELSALSFIAETGYNMDRWATDKHFKSWLNVVPSTEKTGGKIKSEKVRKIKHHAGQILRVAANSLRTSHSELGSYFRRKQTKGGPAKAIIATADKIATSIYHMIKRKQEYNPILLVANGQKRKQIEIERLQKRLQKLQLEVMVAT